MPLSAEQMKRWRPQHELAVGRQTRLWACYAQGKPVAALSWSPETSEIAIRIEAPAGHTPSRLVMTIDGGTLEEAFDDAESSMRDMGWTLTDFGAYRA